MTSFHADLHIHSKYSRATSRDLDLEHLSYWARRKGISVVGTGDFTHPAWRAELKDKLVPAEAGLFRLRSDIEHAVVETLPAACRSATRFMLSVEISTIYKKGDRTRKIHHLIYAPDFETADRISDRLGRIGNISSDGRPILGLDSRDLLEITLESSPDAYLVPAHIWTPWFAALGSQSGFDSIVECYRDLADRIFAVETGLSSDPPMNWRLSQLDRYRMVSNSDAHSPGKLGREATMFNSQMDYFAIRRALETGEGYIGTVEFFPEEGKYHLDGHRKCGVRWTPQQTFDSGNCCPVCGQPTTIGVLHRVETLADRSEADATPPSTAGEVSNMVPLPEVLSEIVSSGPSSKTVERHYDRLVATLGPELTILRDVPLEDITRTTSSLLAEAIARLRAGAVIREAGYDGEYGVIRLFDESELRRLTVSGSMFGEPERAKQKMAVAPVAERPPAPPRTTETQAAEPDVQPQPSLPLASGRAHTPASTGILASLDDDQRRAAETIDGPVVIVAGPGSGKTRTLTHRLAYLIAERGADASACLAITFTRRAAAEMKDRLARLLSAQGDRVAAHTFHSLGLLMLREHAARAGLAQTFRVASEPERIAALSERLGFSSQRAATALRAISRAKRTQQAPGAELDEALSAYREELAARHWIDFDDLVSLPVEMLTAHPDVAASYRDRFRWIAVDEFQDVDQQQYRLLTLLAPAEGNICVIGDPHQAIYGFRGADAACFDRFAQDYPAAATIRLTRNYRSTGTIVSASSQVIAHADAAGPAASIVRGMHERITIHTLPTDHAEAESVVRTIEQLMGGHSLLSIDSGRVSGRSAEALSFSDFAVLYRTDAQSAVLVEAFERSGIPFKKHSQDLLVVQPAVQALLREWDARVDGVESRTLTGQIAEAARHVAVTEDLTAAALQAARQWLMALADACSGDPARFSDTLATARESDFWDPRADRVSLLTMHAAKGLEFPVVFIIGLEDGIVPLYWSSLDELNAAEERRLFYVGMTRAKDRLVLSRAAERLWRGERRMLDASPFLSDIEHHLVTRQQTERRHRIPERQMKLL